VSSAPASSEEVIASLGASEEVQLLRGRLTEWMESVDEELRGALSWALAGSPKHFRPLTVFACHRATHETGTSAEVIELAFAVELIHNMSLIIDDVLDESDGASPRCRASSARSPR
jgi:geranylgeranyl pyrophosphate synthase